MIAPPEVQASFFDVVAAMRSRRPLMICLDGDSREVLIQSIQAEDGSGRSWNVTVNHMRTNNTHVIYWHEINNPRRFLFPR